MDGADFIQHPMMSLFLLAILKPGVTSPELLTAFEF